MSFYNTNNGFQASGNSQFAFQNYNYSQETSHIHQQSFQNTMNNSNYMAGNNGYPFSAPEPALNTRNPDEILPSGLLNALSTKGYSDELPLMEELGINFGNIWKNTMKSVLFKNKHHGESYENDVDLAGPLFFVILYGALLYVYSGKLHFGYIYGVGLFGTVSIHILLKLMSNSGSGGANNASSPSKETTSGLNFLATCSILGYSFLPLCILSGIGIFTHLNSSFGLFLSLLVVIWCSGSSSGEFVKVLSLDNVRMLVAYPLFIFYSVFASMIVFG